MNKDSITSKLVEIEEVAENQQKNYLLELEEVVENECWRSSIVLGWGLFMHQLYEKIEEYGLDSFAKKADEKNRDVNHLNQANDLNDMKDAEVLITSKELGILPNQLEDQLRQIQLRKRNNCAHFGSHNPSENSVYEFFSEIFDAIDNLQEQEFETRETEYLEAIKNMNKEEIGKLPVNGSKTINALSQIKEEIVFIEKEEDYESHKNYLGYVEHVISKTDDEKVIETTINLTLELIRSNVYRKLKKDAEKLLEKALKSKTAKEIVNSNQKLKQEIITAFADSITYRQAERRMKWILKIQETLDEEDWNQIAQSTAQNRQIYEASKCRKILPMKFKENSEFISEGTLDDLSSRSSHWKNIR